MPRHRQHTPPRILPLGAGRLQDESYANPRRSDRRRGRRQSNQHQRKEIRRACQQITRSGPELRRSTNRKAECLRDALSGVESSDATRGGILFRAASSRLFGSRTARIEKCLRMNR